MKCYYCEEQAKPGNSMCQNCLSELPYGFDLIYGIKYKGQLLAEFRRAKDFLEFVEEQKEFLEFDLP